MLGSKLIHVIKMGPRFQNVWITLGYHIDTNPYFAVCDICYKTVWVLCIHCGYRYLLSSFDFFLSVMTHFAWKISMFYSCVILNLCLWYFRWVMSISYEEAYSHIWGNISAFKVLHHICEKSEYWWQLGAEYVTCYHSSQRRPVKSCIETACHDNYVIHP